MARSLIGIRHHRGDSEFDDVPINDQKHGIPKFRVRGMCYFGGEYLYFQQRVELESPILFSSILFSFQVGASGKVKKIHFDMMDCIILK